VAAQLYTSGSTGAPKGVVHSTAGYMVGVAATHRYVFDHRPEDVFFCTADCGWITGHSYVTYGARASGGGVCLGLGPGWASCAFITGMWVLLMAAKQGPYVLFCMPNRTNWIPLFSVMPAAVDGLVEMPAAAAAQARC
jgi:acyl-coenzyme A synthetase/AMP-(fatty) acid ligase